METVNIKNIKELNGILPVFKERRMTSHDVVLRLRKILRIKKIGHMGTLDPLAEGLLLIGLGSGAKLNAYLSELDKSYIAEILIGQSTDTDDSEDDVIEHKIISSLCYDEAYARDILDSFTGRQMQLPPNYSAVKIAGQKAYEISRKGGLPDLRPREVEVYEADLLEIAIEENMRLPIWKVMFTVSKGTYVRSLARDIGKRLACGAHIKELFRDKVGSVCSEEAIGLDELEEADNATKLAYSKLINPLLLIDAPRYDLSREQFSKVENGIKIKLDSQDDCLALCYNKELKAIYEREITEIYKARVVFYKGIFCEED
ncbi:MAG: tRNA pseudouridine(55) synthase TruB [Eggerthellaceae bacterium]|nr:tRNA pseudouridine(55) synthase TruB [Eggerthellaceae bacterium]